MTTTCPACNKAVDPLRSRFVGVLDGKVVAYCSAACAPGRARDIVRTPASGVPVAVSPGPSPRPSLSPPPGTWRPPTPPPGVLLTSDSGPVIEIVHEPDSGVVSGELHEREPARAKHPDEIEIGAFWSADKDRSAVASGAASTAARPSSSAPASAGRDDTLDRWATNDDPGRSGVGRALSAGEGSGTLRHRTRLPLVVVVLLLLGGGGFLVYQYLLKGRVAAATKAAPAVAPVASVVVEPPGPPRPAPDPEPAAVDPAAAVGRARATLAANLSATSPRLQRIAAEALARTGDPAACAVLAAQLGEPSDIARLELAYALARGGDRRGGEVLVAALGSPRGEARDEAARLLALLGDPHAVSHLSDLLAVSQRRLGAAEHLARLAEPRALKVLAQLHDDARTSADDRARAAIALGFAGRADLAPELRALLGDPHVNAFAAAALAELKDGAARPVLERQLDSPSLRVRSARALRRLDPALDPAPLLPGLLDVLQAGRDTDQIQAAEAILLLAGSASWSTYD